MAFRMNAEKRYSAASVVLPMQEIGEISRTVCEPISLHHLLSPRPRGTK